MNTQTDWLSALVILAAGLVLGLLFFYSSKRRNARTPIGEADPLRGDLEARRDALVEQLRDPALSGDERQRLEVETAEVLRKLDDVSGLSPTSSEGAVMERPLNPATNHVLAAAMKGFMWGVTTFAVLGGLGFFVMQQWAPRTKGGAPTDPAARKQQSPERSDATIQQLEAKIRRDPKNLHFRNDLAQAQLERDNLMAVFEVTKVVLDQRPEDSRALTLQAVVRAAMGDAELATTMLKRAARSDPKNLDARVALAWVYAQNDRIQDAQETIAAALKEFPAEKAMLDQILQQMKTQLATGAPRAQHVTQRGQLPPGHPGVGVTAIRPIE